MNPIESTRRSWDAATRNHNAHKGDQAAFLRAGGDTLFEEELGWLGDLQGKQLVHLQCNSGQDSLCLARRGARVTGVDFSGEAVSFARKLSLESGLEAQFIEAEVLHWMQTTEQRFDLAFSSYGATGWLQDIEAWARGVARILRAGGRLVYVEFHPLVWSIHPDLRLTGDDYFAEGPFLEPVSDYVARSGESLGAVDGGEALSNEIPATSWQHSLGALVTAVASAGMRVEALREYPYANGCKLLPVLEPQAGRRWGWAAGVARVPLMFALTARA